MKLESDLPALLPTAAQGPNPGRAQQENGISDPNKLKVVKKITDKKQEAFLCEVKGNGMIADSFPSEFSNEDGFWPILDLECSIPFEDLTIGKGYEMVGAISEDLCGETEFLKRDLDVSTEKSFMESEMPRVVACCQGDDDCYEARDICMDKVVIPDEKILFQTNMVLVADEVVASNPMNEKLEVCHPISDSSEVPEDRCHADPVGSRCPTHLIHPAESSVIEDSKHDSSAARANDVEERSLEVLAHLTAKQKNKGLFDSLNAEEMKDRHEDAAQVSDTISAEHCGVKRGITEAEISSMHKKVLPEALQVESGTMTFSPAEEHSGPVAYLGSLSCRSDSSLGTSTRSFAFPILQCDWNTSPVRMAEPDGRLYRRLSGWKKLVCCKF